MGHERLRKRLRLSYRLVGAQGPPEGTISGGTVKHYYEPVSVGDGQNIIDVGAENWDPLELWGGGADDTPREEILHEFSHTVEGTAHGKRGGGPSYGSSAWGDNPWPHYFVLSYYDGQGLTADFNRARKLWKHCNDIAPAGGGSTTDNCWVTGWFLPIDRAYGGTAVHKRFFEKASLHWPTNAAQEWQRPMYFPEYVFFLSAAANWNLKGLAASAMGGWSATWETQWDSIRANYTQAQISFPDCQDPNSNVFVRLYAQSGLSGACMGTNSFVDLVQWIKGDEYNEFLTDGTLANDAISSVDVKTGYSAVLYLHVRKVAELETYDGSATPLPPGTDNEISGIDVLPPCSDSVLARLYENPTFGSGCWAANTEHPVFTHDEFDDGTVLNDKVSSGRVAPGYNLVIYEDIGFEGTKEVIGADSGFGALNDKASSMKVVRKCSSGAKVRLWQHRSDASSAWEGECISFDGDAIDFTRHNMDGGSRLNDQISAVEVLPGWNAVLYQHIFFEGKKLALLSDTRWIGSEWNDLSSGLRILPECSSASTVQVYQNDEMSGGCRDYSQSDADFRNDFLDDASPVDDNVRSIRVAADCTATIFEKPYYGGRSWVFSGENPQLGAEAGGAGSSIRISC